MSRRRAVDPERAAGAVLGSAVGDALGAPFEFGPEGAFSARFPEPGRGGEMCGGGGWEPGEATDDTQLAVLVGESLLECGGLDPADMFARFRRWAIPAEWSGALHVPLPGSSGRVLGAGELVLLAGELTEAGPVLA